MFSCYRYVILLRPIHTRDFAPGACSRGTLREQSSSVCTDDFMGIHHSWEQNFHPAKCSTIFNRLNIGEQAPGAKRSLMCTDTCKMSLEHAPGAKPLVCIGLYGQRRREEFRKALEGAFKFFPGIKIKPEQEGCF